MLLHLLHPGGSPNHAKSGLALACFIGPTKTFINDKDLTGLIFVEDSVSPKTTTLDIDFAIVNPSSSVEATNVQVPQEESMAKFDCKVIVKDIFEENPTEKSKLLKANLVKNHSGASHRFSDKDFLEQSEKKEPIAWPKMSDDDSWSQLDSAVYSRLLCASSIQEKVELLENTIYDQATCIFGHHLDQIKASEDYIDVLVSP